MLKIFYWNYQNEKILSFKRGQTLVVSEWWKWLLIFYWNIKSFTANTTNNSIAKLFGKLIMWLIKSEKGVATVKVVRCKTNRLNITACSGCIHNMLFYHTHEMSVLFSIQMWLFQFSVCVFSFLSLSC